MQFRYATPTDIPFLAQLNSQLIQDEGHRNPMTVSELDARLRSWLAADYQAILFEDDAGPVGYALFRVEEAAIYLRHFFIARERRRRGLGRQAMEILRTQVFRPDLRIVVEVLAYNQAGIAFWKAMGFRDYALTLELLPAKTPCD